MVDQAAARGRVRDDHTTRPEHHLVKRVARIALEMGILVGGNLALRLLLDGHAAVVVGSSRPVLGDMAEDFIFFSRRVDDGQSVLILFSGH